MRRTGAAERTKMGTEGQKRIEMAEGEKGEMEEKSKKVEKS